MKVASKVLGLLVFHTNAWGTTAFSAQLPKARAFNAHTRQKSELASTRGSRIGTSIGGPEMGGGAEGALGNIRRPDGGGPGDIWDSLTPITVQGGSLRTWSFTSPAVERCQVLLRTEGRPLNANVDLWQGPDNTPQRMGIYIEDGNMRPFSAVIECPRGQNAIAIRNTGQMEFPLAASVEPDVVDSSGRSSAGLEDVMLRLAENSIPETIQGGSLKTYSFEPAVQSVQLLLKTDGRPLNARVELLQGPNNNKQVVELYTEDGMERPFFTVIETPGTGNVVRILNTAPVEFPMSARIEPYLVEPGSEQNVIVTDGGRGWDSRGGGGFGGEIRRY